LKWSGNNQKFDSYVKSVGVYVLGSEAAFKNAVHDGFVIREQVSPQVDIVSDSTQTNDILIDEQSDISSKTSVALIANAVKQSAVNASGDYELELYVKTGPGNGEYAYNPWLHEMPDPILYT
jgi:molybdopterin-containing oxidoreductase family iron-sulfur binding subunit